MTSKGARTALSDEERDRLWFCEGARRARLATRSPRDFEEMFCAFLDTLLAVFGCDRAGLIYPCDPGAESWGFTSIRARSGLATAPNEHAIRSQVSEGCDLFRAAAASQGPVRFVAGDRPLEGAAALFGAHAVLATSVQPGGALGAYLLAIGDDEPRAPHRLEVELFAEAADELSCAIVSLRTARRAHESEKRLAEAGRLAQLGYWEHDLLTDRVFWSDETYRLVGQEPRCCTPVDASCRARIHPDDREREAQVRDAAFRARSPYDLVYRVVRPSGEERTVRSVGDVVRNASGMPYRTFGIIQDITDAKRAEEEIALVRHLLDQTNDGIEVIDPVTGRFIDVNERACVAHGYTREEYLQLRVDDVDPGAAKLSWAERTENLRRVGSLIAECEHRRKDGSTFPVEVSVTLVRHDREYVLAIVRDITERKRLEQELRNAQKMEAIGRLAGGVAHDFNNLLTVVNNGAEMLLESLPSDHADHDLVEDMLDAGLRGANLTRQLLAFSRTQKLEVEVVDLGASLRGLSHLLRRVIGEDITFQLRSSNGPGRVKVDAGQLEQAILNLAVNARDAMPSGGTLVVETGDVDVPPPSEGARRAAVPEGRWVYVRVVDSGHGIAEDDRGRVFDPFFTTKEPGRGTGLGLAMVYGFVKQSGGHVVLESTVGRGTAFTLYLPRIDEPLAARPRVGRSSFPPRGTETVLLVEDEAAVRKLAKRTLQHHGYEVLEAADGLSAMSVFREHHGAVDILVTDVVMPRMSGTELAVALTREQPDLRVVLMSGYSEVAGRSAGNDRASFLAKPFRSKDLARTVRTVLDGTRATAP